MNPSILKICNHWLRKSTGKQHFLTDGETIVRKLRDCFEK